MSSSKEDIRAKMYDKDGNWILTSQELLPRLEEDGFLEKETKAQVEKLTQEAAHRLWMETVMDFDADLIDEDDFDYEDYESKAPRKKAKK